jgi:hypothetical protein
VVGNEHLLPLLVQKYNWEMFVMKMFLHPITTKCTMLGRASLVSLPRAQKKREAHPLFLSSNLTVAESHAALLQPLLL